MPFQSFPRPRYLRGDSQLRDVYDRFIYRVPPSFSMPLVGRLGTVVLVNDHTVPPPARILWKPRKGVSNNLDPCSILDIQKFRIELLCPNI